VGEEREVGDSDRRMGMDPFQFAFWMEVLDAGMGLLVLLMVLFFVGY